MSHPTSSRLYNARILFFSAIVSQRWRIAPKRGSSGRPAVVMMVFMWHLAQVTT
jgi:hypothetical protein